MAKHSLGGRTPLREGKKISRSYSVTEKNHNGLQILAEMLGLPSRSEVIEYLAEKELKELQSLKKSPPLSTHTTNAA